MYILFTGFTREEQTIMESWSKNISPEFSEGFSVGNSLQIGRLVEINQEYLITTQLSLADLIQQSREYRTEFEDYLPYLKELRFFYNRKLNCIFSTSVEDKELGLIVTVTKIPFSIFFKMVDNGKSKAYLGMEEENNIIPDEEIELVEIGFLSRYLVVHFINDTSAFLIEGKDVNEFRKITKFIFTLGEQIGWTWYKDNKEDNKEYNKEN